ncbi:MAG: zinc ribbon domain-containing protein [Dehalococcoidales bacterium]|nr:zinc ribbon domain-containing protein [Dehalococcoidales bacterium]
MKIWNKCPGCSTIITGGNDFCPNCGEPWTIKCPQCGLKWRFWENRNYCPVCGAPIERKGSPKTAKS